MMVMFFIVFFWVVKFRRKFVIGCDMTLAADLGIRQI